MEYLAVPSPGSFWKNPQFQLVLKEKDQDDEEDDDDDDDEDDEDDDEDDEDDEENDEDDDDEEMSPEEKKRAEKQKRKAKQCTVLVELLQKNRRQKDKIHFLYTAFHFYKVGTKLFVCFTFVCL